VGNALQIFISNPRSTALTDISKYNSVSHEIKEYLKENDFKLVIHSPYVINVASEFKNGKRTLTIDECYWIKTIINQLEISDFNRVYWCCSSCWQTCQAILQRWT